jgi:hypothetical protein
MLDVSMPRRSVRRRPWFNVLGWVVAAIVVGLLVATVSQRPAPPKSEEAGISFPTTDAIIASVNAYWRGVGRPGAFVADAPTPIKSGPRAGGSTVNACASRRLCLTIDRDASGRVLMVGMGTDDTGEGQDALDSVLAHIAMADAVFPQPGQLRGIVADLASRAMVTHLPQNQAVQGGCLSAAEPTGLGLWTVAYPGQCDPSKFP